MSPPRPAERVSGLCGQGSDEIPIELLRLLNNFCANDLHVMHSVLCTNSQNRIIKQPKVPYRSTHSQTPRLAHAVWATPNDW